MQNSTNSRVLWELIGWLRRAGLWGGQKLLTVSKDNYGSRILKAALYVNRGNYMKLCTKPAKQSTCKMTEHCTQWSYLLMCKIPVSSVSIYARPGVPAVFCDVEAISPPNKRPPLQYQLDATYIYTAVQCNTGYIRLTDETGIIYRTSTDLPCLQCKMCFPKTGCSNIPRPEEVTAVCKVALLHQRLAFILKECM